MIVPRETHTAVKRIVEGGDLAIKQAALGEDRNSRGNQYDFAVPTPITEER
jgi:hypothetical protein